jgi:hypothetical protein
MRTESQLRKAAVESAKAVLLEKAAARPEELVEGFLKNPHLLSGVRDIGDLFDVLLKNGMYDKLLQLANASTLPRNVRTILVTKLL